MTSSFLNVSLNKFVGGGRGVGGQVTVDPRKGSDVVLDASSANKVPLQAYTCTHQLYEMPILDVSVLVCIYCTYPRISKLAA